MIFRSAVVVYCSPCLYVWHGCRIRSVTRAGQNLGPNLRVFGEFVAPRLGGRSSPAIDGRQKGPASRLSHRLDECPQCAGLPPLSVSCGKAVKSAQRPVATALPRALEPFVTWRTLATAHGTSGIAVIITRSACAAAQAAIRGSAPSVWSLAVSARSVRIVAKTHTALVTSPDEVTSVVAAFHHQR
jgi:hypothetical protein